MNSTSKKESPPHETKTPAQPVRPAKTRSRTQDAADVPDPAASAERPGVSRGRTVGQKGAAARSPKQENL